MTARPFNIVFVMSDDHAAHSISAYGSRINSTPQLDRIADEGMRLTNAFCTNSICAPSRATILTGTHSHVNGVRAFNAFDGRQPTFPGLLQEASYQTALFGKWHLGHGGVHDPRGFDDWAVLPGQGDYHDPELITSAGTRRYQGYATDIITDLGLEWLEARDPTRPFCLLLHHKAPHRPWHPDAKHAKLYEDVDVPEPPTLWDDYTHRAGAAAAARMRIGRDMQPRDWKVELPAGMSPETEVRWKYQRYIKDYLRCVASVDDNVGRVLDYVDDAGLAGRTLVVYTSDQGFFLGDHGWFDKRFMYEESLRMPLLVRCPGLVPAGSIRDAMVLNLDFAQTFLDLADVPALPSMQGRSFVPVLRGEPPADWRRSMYYRYWMHDDHPHHVRAHYGVRTERYKLIYYYGHGLDVLGASDQPAPPEWELFDLQVDPMELCSVIDDPGYSVIRGELEAELDRLQREAGDQPWLPAAR
jgi:arylsulfatase A-like enzyme